MSRRGLAALLALLALGCANRIVLGEPPTEVEPRREPLSAALVIDWIEVRRAGVEVDLRTEVIMRCAEALRSPNLFREVYEPRRAHAAPPDSFHLQLRIEEEFDRHPGATGTKLALTLVGGIGPGLLIPYFYDDRITIAGELRTPDGRLHRYGVERAGSIRSYLLIGLAGADDQLSGRVFGEALRAFAAAVAADFGPQLAAERNP